MRHFHLNEFANGSTLMHRFEARSKIISIFFLIAVAVSLRGLFPLVAIVSLGLILNIWIQMPLGYILNRLLIVLPFALVSAVIFPFIIPGETFWVIDILGNEFLISRQGIKMVGVYILRFVASVLFINFLTGCIGFSGFLHNLCRLKVPKIFLQLTEFTVRYFFVLHSEYKSMTLARKARSFKAKSVVGDKRSLKILTQTLGMLFFRAYTRAEKIFYGMLARGYRGTMPNMYTKQLATKDYLLTGLIFSLGIIVLLYDRGVLA